MLVIYSIKTDYDAKISEIEFKYFVTVNYNKYTSQTLDVKIKHKELVDKSDMSGFINNAKKQQQQ